MSLNFFNQITQSPPPFFEITNSTRFLRPPPPKVLYVYTSGRAYNLFCFQTNIVAFSTHFP